MRKELTTVDPGVQAAFEGLLWRHPDVDAVLLSTNDGVPLLRAIREEGGGVSTGTADAAPSSGSSSSSSSSSLPIESLETKAAALFSIAADQARKMQAQAQQGQQGQGNGDSGCHAIVALYQGFTLVHINLAPLVLTFASREPPPLSASAVSTDGIVGSKPTNVGMILDSQPLYAAALAPLRQAVERQEREAAHSSSSGLQQRGL